MGYLEIFNFHVFGDFLVVFIIDFWFNSIMDREHFKICFIAFISFQSRFQDLL